MTKNDRQLSTISNTRQAQGSGIPSTVTANKFDPDTARSFFKKSEMYADSSSRNNGLSKPNNFSSLSID